MTRLAADGRQLDDGAGTHREFDVERIVDDRAAADGEREYQVKYKGYDELDWCAEEDLSCAAVLREYQQRRATQPLTSLLTHRLSMLHTRIVERRVD